MRAEILTFLFTVVQHPTVRLDANYTLVALINSRNVYKFPFYKGHTIHKKINYNYKCKTLSFSLYNHLLSLDKYIFKSNTKHTVFHSIPTSEHQLLTKSRDGMCSFFALPNLGKLNS